MKSKLLSLEVMCLVMTGLCWRIRLWNALLTWVPRKGILGLNLTSLLLILTNWGWSTSLLWSIRDSITMVHEGQVADEKVVWVGRNPLLERVRVKTERSGSRWHLKLCWRVPCHFLVLQEWMLLVNDLELWDLGMGHCLALEPMFTCSGMLSVNMMTSLGLWVCWWL